ncbi:MAG: septum formation initiator family protein [Acidobacteria bacterium]|nr:septum formation initiator family protein [Acidobacteriota bacterium]
MRRRKRSYAREAWYIFCILLALAMASFTLLGPDGFREMRKVQAEMEAKRARVDSLRQSNRKRLERIEALKTDPKTIEEVARERGFVGPGEIVQQLPADEQAPPLK